MNPGNTEVLGLRKQLYYDKMYDLKWKIMDLKNDLKTVKNEHERYKSEYLKHIRQLQIRNDELYSECRRLFTKYELNKQDQT